MNKFMLNITASSGEYYQGDCEDLVLPISDGVYGIQAGHSPVLVAELYPEIIRILCLEIHLVI